MTSRIKRFALVVTTALAGLSAPGFAQPNETPPSYYKDGPWKVRDIPDSFCLLEHAGDESGHLRLSKSSTEAAYFTFILKSPKPYRTPSFGIAWLFDDDSADGRVLAGKFYQVRDSTEAIEAMFRKADTLTIMHKEERVAQIDLKGSAAAFRKLKACADQYPNSSVPMIPPPAPPLQRDPVPKAKLDGNLPANRTLTPIRPGRWISSSDWREFMNSQTQGVFRVGYSVLVNPQGRVASCDITISSGSGQVDEHTCKLIALRARFNPQTDENGKPVPAKFSGSVRWQRHEPVKDGPNG